MKKNIPLSLIFIFYFFPIFSQSLLTKFQCYNYERLNEQYWITKKRFERNFIINNIDKDGNLENDGIGTWDKDRNRYSQAGTGIPFVSIGSFEIDNGSTAAPEEWEQYLGFLCTEYDLLSKSGFIEEAQKDLNQIFLLLQAYRRLDMTANQLLKQWALHYSFDPLIAAFKPNLSGYSGFFIRGDLPKDNTTLASIVGEGDLDITHFDHGLFDYEGHGIEKKDSGNIISDYFVTVRRDYYNPDFCKGCADFHDLRHVVSQDQIISILVGLTFVKKFIPPTAKVSVNGKYYFPLEIARNIALGFKEYISLYYDFYGCVHPKDNLGNGNKLVDLQNIDPFHLKINEVLFSVPGRTLVYPIKMNYVLQSGLETALTDKNAPIPYIHPHKYYQHVTTGMNINGKYQGLMKTIEFITDIPVDDLLMPFDDRNWNLEIRSLRFTKKGSYNARQTIQLAICSNDYGSWSKGECIIRDAAEKINYSIAPLLMNVLHDKYIFNDCCDFQPNPFKPCFSMNFRDKDQTFILEELCSTMSQYNCNFCSSTDSDIYPCDEKTCETVWNQSGGPFNSNNSMGCPEPVGNQYIAYPRTDFLWVVSLLFSSDFNKSHIPFFNPYNIKSGRYPNNYVSGNKTNCGENFDGVLKLNSKYIQNNLFSLNSELSDFKIIDAKSSKNIRIISMTNTTLKYKITGAGNKNGKIIMILSNGKDDKCNINEIKITTDILIPPNTKPAPLVLEKSCNEFLIKINNYEEFEIDKYNPDLVVFDEKGQKLDTGHFSDIWCEKDVEPEIWNDYGNIHIYIPEICVKNFTAYLDLNITYKDKCGNLYPKSFKLDVDNCFPGLYECHEEISTQLDTFRYNNKGDYSKIDLKGNNDSIIQLTPCDLTCNMISNKEQGIYLKKTDSIIIRKDTSKFENMKFTKKLSNDDYYKKFGVTIYPCPTDNFLNVQLVNDEMLPCSLQIYDLTGKSLLRKQLTEKSTYKIDMSNYPSGMYILKINQKKENFIRKIIID